MFPAQLAKEQELSRARKWKLVKLAKGRVPSARQSNRFWGRSLHSKNVQHALEGEQSLKKNVQSGGENLLHNLGQVVMNAPTSAWNAIKSLPNLLDLTQEGFNLPDVKTSQGLIDLMMKGNPLQAAYKSTMLPGLIENYSNAYGNPFTQEGVNKIAGTIN